VALVAAVGGSCAWPGWWCFDGLILDHWCGWWRPDDVLLAPIRFDLDPSGLCSGEEVVLVLSRR
jgi:hypothetical protein